VRGRQRLFEWGPIYRRRRRRSASRAALAAVAVCKDTHIGAARRHLVFKLWGVTGGKACRPIPAAEAAFG